MKENILLKKGPVHRHMFARLFLTFILLESPVFASSDNPYASDYAPDSMFYISGCDLMFGDGPLHDLRREMNRLTDREAPNISVQGRAYLKKNQRNTIAIYVVEIVESEDQSKQWTGYNAYYPENFLERRYEFKYRNFHPTFRRVFAKALFRYVVGAVNVAIGSAGLMIGYELFSNHQPYLWVPATMTTSLGLGYILTGIHGALDETLTLQNYPLSIFGPLQESNLAFIKKKVKDLLDRSYESPFSDLDTTAIIVTYHRRIDP